MKKKVCGKLPVPALLLILAFACFVLLPAGRQTDVIPDSLLPGDTLTMGMYAGQPVEWVVLDTDEDNCLIISKYGLETMPYHSEWELVTWKDCSLRAWLNGEFLDSCFTEKEREAVLLTTAENGKDSCNPAYPVTGGEDTQDRVFLLSYAEAFLFFGETDGACAPTEHALKTGAYTSSQCTAEGRPAGWYWLRTPGQDQDYAGVVSTDGTITYDNVARNSVMVRPALWLDPGKLKT